MRVSGLFAFALAASAVFFAGCNFTEKVVDQSALSGGTGVSDPGNSIEVVKLKLTSHSAGQRVTSQSILLFGECSNNLGEVKIEGDFKSSPKFVDCVNQRFQSFVELINFNNDNAVILSQGIGADRAQVSLSLSLFVRAAFCGDKVVNQDFEACDGTAGCDEFCQTGGSNPDLVLARVKVSSKFNSGAGRVTNDIFLGSATESIPEKVWFPLFLNGQFFVDSEISGFTSTPGILVRRLATGVKVMLATGLTSSDVEHVSGVLEFHNAVAKSVSGGVGTEAVENGFNGIAELNANEDEIFIESGTSNFWFTERTGHDAYFTEWE